MCNIVSVINKNRTALRISGIYGLCVFSISILFYPLIPFLLNYPPDTYNNWFQWELERANYTQQYILITITTFIVITCWLIISLRNLNGWKESSEHPDQNRSEIQKIRRICHGFPIMAYLVQSIVPSLVVVIIITISTQNITAVTFKLCVIFFSFGTLMSIFSYIFTKRIFTNILLATYTRGDNDSGTIRYSLSKKIFIQLIPIFIVAILFTSLIGYSRLIKEKGDMIFKAYHYQLSKNFDNVQMKNDVELFNRLVSIERISKSDMPFVITPDNEYMSLNREAIFLSDFFTKYLWEYALKGEGHVYDYYGVDVQGIVKEIDVEGEKWVVGVKYLVGSGETLTFFLISFIVLFVLNCIVILYFTKTLTDDIVRVSHNLGEIAGGKDMSFSELALTSNDEIGDLIIAFNNIQQREKEHIESIKKNQEILLEQERLASLGQLIGGIAHNLKTPIMSISGGIEALRDLVFEYRDSIDDKSVTEQDHKEIARDMMSWLDRMKPYCGYMSDVISAVKGQAVQMSASVTNKFTVDELIKRVDLLMKHELKKYHCILKTEMHIDMSTEIKGEVTNLVQVFDNIIINAMQAYEGENGTIDLKITRSGDNVEFVFKDQGKGIPKEIADRLFKEMVTTKGKKGTGLGLYMSYSTIKGRFGGNMSFISKEGHGTTFFISIPCITYNRQEA